MAKSTAAIPVACWQPVRNGLPSALTFVSDRPEPLGELDPHTKLTYAPHTLTLAILSVPDATLRDMDTLNDSVDTEPRFPLSDAEFDAVCHETARRFGLVPFRRGASVTHSLWLMFQTRQGDHRTGEWVPLDFSLDMADEEQLAADCDFLAEEMADQLPDEMALLILLRPGPAEIGEVDRYVFRVMCQSMAGRETGPWSFYVTGPDGAHKVS
jgi:hypothetical protein